MVVLGRVVCLDVLIERLRWTLMINQGRMAEMLRLQEECVNEESRE